MATTSGRSTPPDELELLDEDDELLDDELELLDDDELLEDDDDELDDELLDEPAPEEEELLELPPGG